MPDGLGAALMEFDLSMSGFTHTPINLRICLIGSWFINGHFCQIQTFRLNIYYIIIFFFYFLI